MTNLYFERLQRDQRFQKKEAPPPAPSGLGEAIENIIRQQVEECIGDALEKQRPNPAIPVHRRPFTDKPDQHTFPAGPPQAKPPRDLTISTQRDELKRLKFITIGNDVRFEVQRDGEGRVVRMVQLD